VTGVEFNVDYTAVSAVLSLGTGWLLINTGRAFGQARLMVVAVRAWRADRRRRSRVAAAVDGYQIGVTSGRSLASYVEVWKDEVAQGFVCGVSVPDAPGGVCGVPVEAEPCPEHGPIPADP
jgi:hypothetical protein